MTRPEDIAHLERRYRVRFPSAFSSLHLSGAITALECREVLADGKRRLIEKVLRIPRVGIAQAERTWLDLNVVTTQLESRLYLADASEHVDIVPFAEMFAGDLLSFRYDPPNRTDPTVVVWSHEESEEGSPVTSLVSPTFDEFMRTGLLEANR